MVAAKAGETRRKAQSAGPGTETQTEGSQDTRAHIKIGQET